MLTVMLLLCVIISQVMDDVDCYVIVMCHCFTGHG